MDREQITKAVGSVIAVLLVIAAAFGAREDAGDDIQRAVKGIADNPIPSILILVALLLGLWLWRNEVRKAIGLRSPADIGKTLRDWAYRHGYTIQDTSNPEAHFQFVVLDFQGRPINIAKPKGEREKATCRLLVGLHIDDDLAQDLNNAPEPIRTETLADLQVEMARRGLRFTGIRYPLQDVTLHSVIPDTLSEYHFIEEIQNMTNAAASFLSILHLARVRGAIARGTSLPSAPDMEEPQPQEG